MTIRSAARTQPRFFPLARGAVLMVGAALILAGCGYTLGPDNPGILARTASGALPTLKLKTVENPTLFPWINYILRGYLRDEINARHIAAWVDSGRADYEISIKVDHFTYRSRVYDPDDMPILYESDIMLEATVFKGDTNEIIWRSGHMRYMQSYESVAEKSAAEEILQQLARQLVDKMRQEF